MRKLVLRFSELNTLTECQLKYKLGYAAGLVADGTKPALARGTLFHAALEGHYTSFAEDDAAGVPRDLGRAKSYAVLGLQGVLAEDAPIYKAYTDEMRESIRWMYAGFVERWGTDPDYDQILSIENRRTVPLVSHLGVRVYLAVTADLIVHHRVYDRVLLVDHKTESGRDAAKEATSKDNQLDAQRATYSASYSLQGPKKDRIPIFGALHNVIRSDQLKREMLPEERFARAPVYYGNIELNNVWEETKNIARDAVEIRLGRGRAKRMYSSPDPQRCSWKCQFKEVHLTARATGRDPVQVAIDYGFRPANAGNPFIGTMEDA